MSTSAEFRSRRQCRGPFILIIVRHLLNGPAAATAASDPTGTPGAPAAAARPATPAANSPSVLQGPDDGLDALAEPVGERAGLFLSLRGRAQEDELQVVAAKKSSGVLPGQVLVRWPAGLVRATRHLGGLERTAGSHIRAGLAAMVAAGELRPGTDVDSLAVSTAPSLQGGLILTQACRDPRRLRQALNGALVLIATYRTTAPGNSRLMREMGPGWRKVTGGPGYRIRGGCWCPDARYRRRKRAWRWPLCRRCCGHGGYRRAGRSRSRIRRGSRCGRPA